MVIAILVAWIALLWLLVAVGVFERWTLWMKLSPVVLYLVLTIGLIIPMTQSAPLGPAAVLAYSVQVAPNVSGSVTEVPVKAGVPKSYVGRVLRLTLLAPEIVEAILKRRQPVAWIDCCSDFLLSGGSSGR
jgi:hypothetical protein